RQYYMDGWYPTGSKSAGDAFTPSAALIKATIINSAREMNGAGAYANGENKYPNDNQGFGRVTLDDALFFQGDARGLTVDDHRSGINTGDTVTYNLAIGDSTLPVEVTLVWTDYPGTANCGPCLVNDLDLQVTAPDGTTYNGNQYMGFNPGESQPNPSDRDKLNNVESVLVISNVQAGLWTVTVHGFNVPQGPQTLALVLTGGIAMYYDNNNGLGGSGPVYAYAVVDDSPPVISGIGVSNLRFNRADIGWTTDELSDSLVYWGVGTPPGNTTGEPTRTMSHSIALTG